MIYQDHNATTAPVPTVPAAMGARRCAEWLRFEGVGALRAGMARHGLPTKFVRPPQMKCSLCCKSH